MSMRTNQHQPINLRTSACVDPRTRLCATQSRSCNFEAHGCRLVSAVSSLPITARAQSADHS
eukprot:3573904-Pleurochrysis_carterae.AAC.1